RSALAAAIRVARAGQPINRIGRAIQGVANTHRLRIIENLGGHGVGRSLHEEPEHILGFYDSRDRRVLHEGMVIAIEPFLSTKSKTVSEADDGWTLLGAPGNLSAQFEHTILITRGAPIILTVH
ncbi:MAG TPA: M24 family metallopeptidase, partial [Spongiibacteraceae bacterium]|nr:M24 family metallopeptidase [Spongiibacteraceae bacterium]